MLWRTARLLAGILCCAILISPVLAQQATSGQSNTKSKPVASRWAQVNKGNVWIISGGINGTYIRIADDLAALLDSEKGLRVLPVRGKGSIQNITDMLYLKGIDIGIVQSDVLSYVKREKIYPNIEDRVRYITKLYNEEFHLLAANGIDTVDALAGKKVNFGIRGSGTYVTASTVFAALGLDVEPTTFDQGLALQKVKTGEIAALVYVAGKPTALFKDLTAEDGVHLLPVTSPNLLETYLPSTFAAPDYPGLVQPGETINTVAVGAVMAAYNWPHDHARLANIVKFTEAFFSRFGEFQEAPRHPKWKEVNLAAELPGWTRLPAAEEWLRRNAAPPAETEIDEESELKVAFLKFLKEEMTGAGSRLEDDDQDQLVKKFIRWKESPSQTTITMSLTATTGIGRPIGTIEASNTEIEIGGVREQALLLKPNLAGLTPGEHAFRIHENPACGAKQKDGKMVPGLAAGAHLFATGTGGSGSKVYSVHLGNLPNVVVADDGTAWKEIVVPRLKMSDLPGRSLMIHASANDRSARFACGVVK